MKEGSVSGFDPHEFSAIRVDPLATGVQFPQLLVNPPQVPQAPQLPQAPQAVNSPAQASGTTCSG